MMGRSTSMLDNQGFVLELRGGIGYGFFFFFLGGCKGMVVNLVLVTIYFMCIFAM